MQENQPPTAVKLLCQVEFSINDIPSLIYIFAIVFAQVSEPPVVHPINTKSLYPSLFKSPKAVAVNLAPVKLLCQVEFSISATLLEETKLIKKEKLSRRKLFFYPFNTEQNPL